jgi:hypothetical protein
MSVVLKESGPDNAGANRSAVNHEIVALILTAIRAAAPKRRTPANSILRSL